MTMNEGTVTGAANVLVRVRARLVLRPECQVEEPDLWAPCLSLPSSSEPSLNTSCCASRQLRPRTDGSVSTTGTTCRQRKLGRGSAIIPKGIHRRLLNKRTTDTPWLMLKMDVFWLSRSTTGTRSALDEAASSPGRRARWNTSAPSQ
jgi:hypothetical protein